jgi:hypothetical protein
VSWPHVSSRILARLQVQVAGVVVDDVPVGLLGLRMPFDQVEGHGLRARRERGRGDEAGNGGWRLCPGQSRGIGAGHDDSPRCAQWLRGYSGHAERVMMSTKSARVKPGAKWASTSSFIVPKVVSGRSFIPS